MGFTRHGRIIAFAAGLGLASASSPATAAPGAEPRPTNQRAALLPLQVEGELSKGWRDRIVEDLSRGLVQAGMEVVDPKTVVEASGGGGDCKNAKCFGFLSTSLEARFLVRAKISVEARNYSVTLDVIDGSDGSIAASSSEGCQLCGLSEVGDLVTKQAAALRQKVDVLSLEPAVITITSEPGGATIFIDGAEIGSTPLERELSPGQHQAEARKAGFLDQTRTLEAVQGIRETLRFELLPDSGEDARAKGWMAPVGWTFLGIGVAGLAAGTTFLVLDQQPREGRCSGPDVDEFGNCRQLYDTLIHGAVFAATGGALLVTGIALLARDRVVRGKRAKEMASRLRVGPGTLNVRF